MPRPLPKADTTTDVLLVALCERLDKIIELLKPEPAAPAARKRAAAR